MTAKASKTEKETEAIDAANASKKAEPTTKEDSPGVKGLRLNLVLTKQAMQQSGTLALANKLIQVIKNLVTEAETKGFEVALVNIELTTIPRDMIDEEEKKRLAEKAAVKGVVKDRIRKAVKKKQAEDAAATEKAD